jgi:hypothetical protein
MAKLKIRKNDSLLTIKVEDNTRLILNLQCINIAHYHCTMFAVQQSLRGIQGDTSPITIGVQYAKSQMYQNESLSRSTDRPNT